MFIVYDRQTRKTVGKPYQDRNRARRRADRLDNEYGAYRYGVRTLETVVIVDSGETINVAAPEPTIVP